MQLVSLAYLIRGVSTYCIHNLAYTTYSYTASAVRDE